MKRKKGKRAWATLIAVAAVILFLAYDQGWVYPAYPDTKKYPCLGIDVSHHQGSIDWEKAGQTGVAFAYIKATEGEGYEDPMYGQNSAGCEKAGILYGAYHFFRFDKDGQAQAKHLLQTAPYQKGMLPYAVDVEFEGNTESFDTEFDTQAVADELVKFIDTIKEHCGFAPVIYALPDSYARFIKGRFADCPLWIRGVFLKPALPDTREYILWQFSASGRVVGVAGAVDKDVFMGSREAFEQWAGMGGLPQ